MITKFQKMPMFNEISDSWVRLRQIRNHGLHKFSPKVPIHFKIGSLVLKTVTEKYELIEALKLRYEVFFEEMQGKTKKGGIDVDEFDALCDHLVIIDSKTDRIVGTYRLNCSKFSNTFYSAGEFQMERLLRDTHIKVELGRACIHKNFRKGTIISLLWRGIAEYMNQTGAQYLFGCGSVKTKDPHTAALLFQLLKEDGRLTQRFYCPTTLPYSMPGLPEEIAKLSGGLSESQRDSARSLIPPLLNSYLKAGVEICGEPAWDVDFQCIDFLTLLDRSRLNGVHSKRYSVESQNPSLHI